MHKEPIRHHYIPQFILKNFCFEDRKFYYFNKRLQTISVAETRDTFMVKNLYRDEINHPADPVKIEKDLAAYENEISRIIKERFLQEKDIVLSVEEEAKLRLFFAIMGFRSYDAQRQFGDKMQMESKGLYRHYQADENFLDLWKRNLGYVVNCRSIEQVLSHPSIDEPFKIFFHRDTVGYFGRYFAVAEANENSAFVIGDVYPVVVEGTTAWGQKLDMYSIYPISPKRVIFLANNGVSGTPRSVLQLREFIFNQPKHMTETNSIQIRVKRLSSDEVQYINRTIAQNADQGFGFKEIPRDLMKTEK